MATEHTQAPEQYEEQHVHEVYENIALHFSSTRYKPWPIVHDFLQSIPAGSVGLDVGCGNGKYLPVNKDVFIVGSDRSTNLVKIAHKHQPHSAIVADNLSLPHGGGAVSGGRFDFAISIAVIHHLSSPERRVDAIRSILECLRSGGKALIYVWALEQKNSRRGWDESNAQDVMVPWVMRTGKQDLGNGQVSEPKETTFQRYYHLYRSGELEGYIHDAGGEVVNSGYDRDNWWAVAVPRRAPV